MRYGCVKLDRQASLSDEPVVPQPSGPIEAHRHGSNNRRLSSIEPGGGNLLRLMPVAVGWLLWAGLIAAGTVLLAADNPFAIQTEQQFLESRRVYKSDPNKLQSAWQFGRACFDWAEFASNDDQREEIAQQGIEACRRAIGIDPHCAPSHYYLAMNLGQLARTKTLGALRLVNEMDEHFKRAIQLDPAFDYAGPHRSLGLLYFDAPGWPTSIGSRTKARVHLEKAVELAPDYPENHLCLIEAYLRWGDKRAVQKEFTQLEALLPAARRQFADPKWKASWIDWEKRWAAVRKKAGAFANSDL